MELKKIRIQNYKSIIDTGIIHINKDLTIFAGMNESGKTSILEAIRDFDEQNSVNKDAKRLKTPNAKPLISLYFSPSAFDIETVYENLNVDDDKIPQEFQNYLIENGFGISKDINNSYILDDDTKKCIETYFSNAYKEYYKKHKIILNKLKQIDLLSSINFSSVTSKSNYSDMYDLIKKVKSIVNPIKIVEERDSTGKLVKKSIPQKSPFSEEEQSYIQELIQQIENDEITVFNYYHLDDFLDDLKIQLLSLLPRIIFFSTFDDELKYNVPISEIKKNEINLDLCNIAGIDIEELAGLIELEDYQGVDNYLSDKSANISNIFKSEWLQDEINIAFNSNKEIIHFAINENGDTCKYRADQRSKGFQWFLSFYIRLNRKINKANIILVDEPGLYLHAKAQDDVLKLLEKLSNYEDTTVMFTTHSPYLIDVDKLNRVLLVEKDDRQGTKILKAHKGASQNTLTPIITKMGFDISKANFIRGKNILTEGISDYYYIQAFKEILGYSDLLKNVSIIPSVGASQLPHLASFCIGWGFDYVALFDNDSEGTRFSSEINKNLVDKASCCFISDKENCSIEDLFTVNDFNKFVLKNVNKENTENLQNTEFLKSNKQEKTLIAKLFYDNANEIKLDMLDKETIDNFRELFGRIFVKLNIKSS